MGQTCARAEETVSANPCRRAAAASRPEATCGLSARERASIRAWPRLAGSASLPCWPVLQGCKKARWTRTAAARGALLAVSCTCRCTCAARALVGPTKCAWPLHGGTPGDAHGQQGISQEPLVTLFADQTDGGVQLSSSWHRCCMLLPLVHSCRVGIGIQLGPV